MRTQSRPDSCLTYFKSDVMRYYGKCDLKTCLKGWFQRSVLRWHLAFRLCGGRGAAKYLGYFLWALSRTRSSVQIMPGTKIGYGLCIGHGGPVVVNRSAKIGDNCNLSQFTTIGSNYGHAATIGNNVYIGPSVCIVEDVIIGDNVTIGAGSVVTKDIPDNATAVGNYAKVINYNHPGRFIKRRWVRE